MLETRQQRRTDCATTAPMPTARPRASRSSPEAALRCAAGAGLDGDPRGRATLGRAVWCGATNQPPRRCTPPPRKWRDVTHPNHPQFQPTNQSFSDELSDNSPRPQTKVKAVLAGIFTIDPTKHLLLLPCCQLARATGAFA